MVSKSSSLSKVKVTASLDAELMKEIDAFLKTSSTRSRSQLIENVLRDWHRQQKKRALESQIEEYYVSLSEEEREEDRQWSEIGAQSALRLWEV